MARAKSTLPQWRRRYKPRAPERPQPAGGRAAGIATDETIVLDDLPDMIPVTRPELEVIKIYLGTIIDELLAGAAPARTAKPIPTANPGKPIRASRPRS